MDNKVNRFFKINNINTDDIKYVIHENKKTAVFLIEGKSIETWIPMKDIYENLPKNDFLNIQKGILVNAKQIVNISYNGIYTMTDGHTFASTVLSSDDYIPPLGLLEKCTLLDKMPLAFCVIELVFDEKGHGVDFVFRYCNEMMADVEGIPVSEMINRSFYEVFENGDKKWLVTYADVALNGNKRILTDYSPEIDKHLTIYCYQPIPGYCACILIPK